MQVEAGCREGGMTRALFAALIAFSLVPAGAEAQQTGRMRRIGILTVGQCALEISPFFLQPLREAGYEIGRSLVIDRRCYADLAQLDAMAHELVTLKADVIVTQGAPAAHAAKKATGTIPIVISFISDPVAYGLVDSLARPGGNVTGITSNVMELYPKRIQLMRDLVPTMKAFGVLTNATEHPLVPSMIRTIEATAASLGISARVFYTDGPEQYRARGPDLLAEIFDAAREERLDMLLVAQDSFNSTNRKRIIELAAANRLPAIYTLDRVVAEGGLVSYGPNAQDILMRVAAYVIKLLAGTRPADLPVEQATKFDLAINLKAAKALGIAIPPLFLERADRLIEE